MLRSLRNLFSDARARRAGDGLIALAVLGASLFEIFVSSGSGSGWYGPRWADVVCALAISVPLAARVRAPLAMYAVIFAGSAGTVVLAGSHQPPFEPFLALVIGAYSIGAHVGARREWLGLGVAVVPALIGSIVMTTIGPQSLGNSFPTDVWLLGAWVVGRIIRGWRDRAHELERLTDLQAEAAVAVERARIARELHDVIAHNVSMMVVQASAAARVLEGDQPNVLRALETVETTGRETVDEMRRLIGVVRNEDGLALAPQPTLADVERLVANVREAGLPVELRIEGEPLPLPPGVDLSAYRIVQEALTNTLKHAGRARATVVVRYGAASVEVEVHDDGDASGVGAGSGHGLIGMQERVALWGGELEAGRRQGGGFAVRARLPVGA